MASHGEEEDLDTLRSEVLASMKNKPSTVQEDEDEELELQKLREAALKTKKSAATVAPAPIPLLELPLEPPQPVETIPTIHTDVRLPPLPQEPALLPRGPYTPRRGIYHRGQPHRRGFHSQGTRGGSPGWSNNHARPGAAPRGANLIFIQPLPMEGEEPQPPRGMGRGEANGSGMGMAMAPSSRGRGLGTAKPILVRPQDKWHASGGGDNLAVAKEPTHKSRDKFSRYKDSDSEESEDSESDEDSARTKRHYFHYSSDESEASCGEAEAANGPGECEASNISNASDAGGCDLLAASPKPDEVHEQPGSPQPSNNHHHSPSLPSQPHESCDHPTSSPNLHAQNSSSSSRRNGNHGSSSSQSSSSSSSSGSTSSSSGDSGGDESDNESGMSDAKSAESAKNGNGKTTSVSSPLSSSTHAKCASPVSSGLLSPQEVSAGHEKVPVLAKADSTLSPKSHPAKLDSATSQSSRGEQSLDPSEQEKREARRRKFENSSDLSCSAPKKILLKGIVSSSTRTEKKDSVETKSQSSPCRSDSRSPIPSSRGSASSGREKSPRRYQRHRSPLQSKVGSSHYNHRDRQEKDERQRPRSDRHSENPRTRQKDDLHSAQSRDGSLGRVEKRVSDLPKEESQDFALGNKNQNAHLSDSDTDDEDDRFWKRKSGLQTESASHPSKMYSRQPGDSQRLSSYRSRPQNHFRHTKPLSVNGGRNYSSQSRHSDTERGFYPRHHYAKGQASDSDSDSKTSNKRSLCSRIIRPVTDRNGKRSSLSPSPHDRQSMQKCRRLSEEGNSSQARARDQALSEDSDGSRKRSYTHQEYRPFRGKLADQEDPAAKSAKSSKRICVEEDSDSRKPVPKVSVHERLGRKVTVPGGSHREHKRSVLMSPDSSEKKTEDKPVVKKTLSSGVEVKGNGTLRARDTPTTARGGGGVFRRAAAGLGGDKEAEKTMSKEELLEQRMSRMKKFNEAILRRHKEIEEDKKRHGSL